MRSLINCGVCAEDNWSWWWERLLTYNDNNYEDNVEREVGEPFPGRFLRYRMGRRGQSVSVTTSNTALLNNALGKIFIKKRDACQRVDMQKNTFDLRQSVNLNSQNLYKCIQAEKDRSQWCRKSYVRLWAVLTPICKGVKPHLRNVSNATAHCFNLKGYILILFV